MAKEKPESLLSAKNLLSLSGGLAMTAGAVFLFSRVQFMRHVGLLGVFIISLVSSATIFLPLPGFAVVFAMGAYLNPLLVGIAAGLGSGLGEISGFLLGYAGHSAVERTKIYRSHKGQVEKYGPPAVFVLAFVPNPVFDLAGIASGALKMPWWQFLIATIAGKSLRYILVAYLGLYSAGWL
ncbi:SNARE associated Golgi protein [uncultured archaeon]|nr:SNARE associated Golgi protein [uncultured archaeon]